VNLTYREQLILVNIRQGLSERKSFRKLVSYAGAVRMPEWIDAGWTCWVHDNGTRYMDVGNYHYAAVFTRAWPTVVERHNLSNNETVGDLIEALLGWYFVRTELRGHRLTDFCDDTIAMLEQACVAQWALYAFFAVD